MTGSSEAYWFVQNHVVYVHNVGDLTGDLFRSVNEQIIAYMKQAYEVDSTVKVHVFVDSLDMSKLPHITDLEGGRILSYMKEPNCGWSVVVGYRNNPFLAVLSRLLTSIMGVDLYMADTLSKGVSLIKQVEPTLTNIPDINEWRRENIPTT